MNEKKSADTQLNTGGLPENENTDSQLNPDEYGENKSVEEEREKGHENKLISDSNIANESSSTTMDCSNIVTHTDQIEEENILARGQLETCEESSTVESIGM